MSTTSSTSTLAALDILLHRVLHVRHIAGWCCKSITSAKSFGGVEWDKGIVSNASIAICYHDSPLPESSMLPMTQNPALATEFSITVLFNLLQSSSSGISNYKHIRQASRINIISQTSNIALHQSTSSQSRTNWNNNLVDILPNNTSRSSSASS